LSVTGAHSVGREWAGLILAIFSGNVLSRRYLILAQSGRRDHSDDRSGVTSGLVRLGLHPLSAKLSHALLRSPCQRDGAPGEGCLTEAWPRASCHARWRNEMVCRGNHHYGGGRQRLWTPPPVVSQGPRERRYPFVRGSCSLSPCRKIRRVGVGESARGLSWSTCLSGGAASLERTSQVIRHGSDPERQVGGAHVSQEAGLLDP